MAYLNANIPPIYCKIKKEYLYDMDKNYNKDSEDCVVFGITSITGRAILFNIMLPNGACYWRLPISAFFQKHLCRTEVPNMLLHELELWNCFSYYPSVHRFDWLDGLDGKYLGLNKKFYHKTVTTAEIENFISESLDIDLSSVFDQYLRDIRIPVLEYEINDGFLKYRWNNVIENFKMPVKIIIDETPLVINPTKNYKKIAFDSNKLIVDKNFYVFSKDLSKKEGI